jgi:4-amino-4-deoxy-L-arabinose transferase-like glycosyltransferase
MVFVFSLVLRLSALQPHGFDGLYGQDAYAYYDFAGELRSAVSTGRAPGPFFWPLGYPALLAVGFTVFGQSPAVGQAISIVAGSLLPMLVYVLTRQVGAGFIGAAVAGVLMVVCGQALHSSLVIMADVPGLFWATLSAVALWQYLSHPHKLRWLLLSATCLALACITRWLSLVLVIPWGAALLIGRRGRLPWHGIALAGLTGLALLMPQIAYSLVNPYPTLNHAWVEGWSPANAVHQVFDNVDGHFEYEHINAQFYAQVYHDPYYLSPVITPFVLAGLIALLGRKQFAALALLLGWGVLPYLFLAGIPYQNTRFPLIVFPAVAALAGVGVEAEWRLLQRWRLPNRVALAFLMMVMVFGAGHTLRLAQTNLAAFISRQQDDKDTARWAAGIIPPGATVYTFGLTLTLKHYTGLQVYELYYETPATLEQRWTPGQVDFLLLNVWNIEHQWAGRTPQADYHWLRDRRGLVKLGQQGYYALYQVKG